MSIFGDRLRYLRESKELMSKDFAKHMNVEPSTVTNWEKGNRFPKEDVLIALADYFNVSSDYLLGRTDNPNNDVVEVTHNGEEYIFEFKTGKKKVDKDEIQEIINKYESMQDFINDFTKK